jgi:translation initiation factor eIF-2B subunit alpha/methylthioribose-1-phosphate isomerase
MKVKINGKRKDYKTVWMKNSTIFLIDQRKLPQEFKIFKAENYRETAKAIKEMVVRGAPAIGVTAAYGMTQTVMKFSGSSLKSFLTHMKIAEKTLKGTRPTAFDLFYAVDLVIKEIKKAKNVEEAKRLVKKVSEKYAKASEEKCRLIGKHGEKLIHDGDKILTHCNAGALGCVDYGTALAPIRFAHYSRKKIFVWVDETRPRLQGAKLTSWELSNEDIPHAIIVDNAAGYFMKRGEVDLVIVGADRIAGNGDVANKIGTYEKAVLAKENDIPFYVAAPFTTIDKNCKTGDDIKIEERSEEEVLFIGNERISSEDSKARNPAFDVTPKKYIKGIITEKGIFEPDEVKKKIFS